MQRVFCIANSLSLNALFEALDALTALGVLFPFHSSCFLERRNRLERVTSVGRDGELQPSGVLLDGQGGRQTDCTEVRCPRRAAQKTLKEAQGGETPES